MLTHPTVGKMYARIKHNYRFNKDNRFVRTEKKDITDEIENFISTCKDNMDNLTVCSKFIL